MAKEHKLEVPENAGKGLTSWIAVCSCGAEWHCYYSRYGLEWKARNDKCKSCPYNRS